MGGHDSRCGWQSMTSRTPCWWLTSGVGEFRALMIDAGKRLLELAIAD